METIMLDLLVCGIIWFFGDLDFFDEKDLWETSLTLFGSRNSFTDPHIFIRNPLKEDAKTGVKESSFHGTSIDNNLSS